MKKSEQDILEIAKAIMKETPGKTPHSALRQAKDIYRNRGKYKVRADEKAISGAKTPWKDLPDHIKRNIKRQRKVQSEREKARRELPTPTIVPGGKVSPK